MINFERLQERKFSSVLGISKQAYNQIWSSLEGAASGCSVPFQKKHLNWTLFWLKNYLTADVTSQICSADTKTINYWIYHTLFVLIARLDEVLNNCYEQTKVIAAIFFN